MDETDIENYQIVGVMHADKQRRVKKAQYSEDFKDELISEYFQAVHEPC